MSNRSLRASYSILIILLAIRLCSASAAEPADTEVPLGSPVHLSADVVKLTGEEIDYQWFKDGESIPGATDTALTLGETSYEDEGIYQVVATSDRGEQRSRLVQVRVTGEVSELDPNFATDLSIEQDLSWFDVKALADGKVVLNTGFGRVNGRPSNGFARLNADGTLDEAFPVDQEAGIFHAVAAPDGSLYGGLRDDAIFNGRLGRRLPTGEFEFFPLPEGFEGAGDAVIAIQPNDGGILHAVRPIANPRQLSLFRFLPDGQVDRSFTPVRLETADESSSALVRSIVVLDDGRILAGGQWSLADDGAVSVSRGLMRLHSNGAIDRTYEGSPFGEGEVSIDQILKVGGRIAITDGIDVKMMNLDGEVDETFQPDDTQGYFHSISMDLQGRVYFSRQHPATKHWRLLSTGEFDRMLPVGLSREEGAVTYFEPHLDGMLVVSDFDYYDGVRVPNGLARLRSIGELPVVFADQRLEEAIQESLSLGETAVTVAVLAEVEELHLDALGIVDLRGLENARGLRVLSIRDNEVTDLAPLRDLMIDELLVSGNPIVETERLEIGFRIEKPERFSLTKLRWETEDGALYQVEESRDLERWRPSSYLLRGDGSTEAYPLLFGRPGYFRVVKR